MSILIGRIKNVNFAQRSVCLHDFDRKLRNMGRSRCYRLVFIGRSTTGVWLLRGMSYVIIFLRFLSKTVNSMEESVDVGWVAHRCRLFVVKQPP